jgi:hypothetical protein
MKLTNAMQAISTAKPRRLSDRCGYKWIIVGSDFTARKLEALDVF